MVLDGMASVRIVSQRQLDRLWRRTTPNDRWISRELSDLGLISVWNLRTKEFWITYLPPTLLQCRGCQQELPRDAPPPWWVKAPKI